MHFLLFSFFKEEKCKEDASPLHLETAEAVKDKEMPVERSNTADEDVHTTVSH